MARGIKRGSGFNSRTCEGATGVIQRKILYFMVSIHAPVKVRLAAICKDESEKLFQFTHL